MKYGLALGLLLVGTACTSVTAVRPDQELSDALSAIKAAKEVQAETLSPGMYRKARELLEEGKRDFRLKNYEESRLNLKRARLAAEQAELASLKSGGIRAGGAEPPKDPMINPSPSPSPTH